MKLLLVTLNFAPELTGIGRFNREMVEWLVGRGHDVRVICAPPYYPAWRVSAGYHAFRYRTTLEQGAQVTRCPLYVPQKPTGLRRLLHLLSFGLSSGPVIVWTAMRWKPDCVFLTMPPMACAPAVLLGARFAAAKTWLHVQDFEVDAAFNLGMVRGTTARRLFLWLERRLLGRFTRVSTISGRMMERLQDKGLPAHRTLLFPNWTDFDQIRPVDVPSPYRAQLGIEPQTCVFLYSGTLGVKQGIDLLVDAFSLLGNDVKVALVICGEGPARPALEARIAAERRIHLLPLQPADRLNALLSLGDVQVLPQRSEAEDLVMPSKLPTMLASGGAVIACAGPGSEMAAVLAGVAVVVPPGDVAALSAALRDLAVAPEQRSRLGRLGREHARRLWDRDAVLSTAFAGKDLG